MKPLAIDLARPGPWSARWALAARVVPPALAVVLIGAGWAWRLEARSIAVSGASALAASAGPVPEPGLAPGRLESGPGSTAVTTAITTAVTTAESTAESAQALVRVASAPVGEVLAAIESSLEPGLRVVRLEIDASLGQAALDGEAPGHAEAMAWVGRLNAPPSTARWALVRSRRAPGDGSAAGHTRPPEAAGVVFTLRATW